MPGPWERFQKAAPENAAAEGPWSKYQRPSMEAASPEHDASEARASEAKTALENYGDTMTLGYLPHLQAVGEKVMTPVLNAITGNDVKSDKYIDARDSNRRRIEKESEENKAAAIAGKVAGIVNQAPLLAAKALQGASAATKIANAAQTGAVVGALQNPGDTEGGWGIQLEDRAKNAALGGAIGAGATSLVEGAPLIKDGAKKFAKWAGDLADEKAAKVLGNLSKFEHAAEKGTAKQIGRVLREEGAIKPWTTRKAASEAVDRIREEAGKEIGSILEKANTGTKIDTAKMAKTIRSSQTLKEMANTPGMEAAYTRIHGMLDTLAKNGEVDLLQAQRLRQMVDRGIKFARRGDSPIPEEGLKAIRTTVRDTMNDAVNASDELAGKAGSDRLLKANKKYSLMAEAGDIADQQLARDAKNRTISLTDTISGVAGAASGGPLTGIATGLANKALRTFGNSTAASALGAAERVLLKIPQFADMAKKKPELFSSYVQRLGERVRHGNFEGLPPEIEQLYRSAEVESRGSTNRESASVDLRGEAKWAAQGAEKLGIDPGQIERIMQSREGRRLLIEASDLPAGSKRLESILNQISRGDQYGSGSSAGDEATVLRQQRKPSSGR